MDGIVFIARLGSTRLSQKHLIKAKGKTFIEWLIARFAAEFGSEIQNNKVQLILLTADEPENKLFEEVLQAYPVKVFFGSVNNIPLRLLQCVDHYNLENLISVDGDDVLCSTQGARKIWECMHNATGDDAPALVKTVGLPLGMNIMGLRRSLLTTKREKIGTGKLETGWGWVFDDAIKKDIELGSAEVDGQMRFTLDYQEDAEFFSAIINGIDVVDAKDEEVIDFVKKESLTRLNGHLNDQYWANFKKQQSGEKQ